MKRQRMEMVLGIISAILLTGMGVALFVHANLGSDTITVFVDGVHSFLHVSYGTASRIYNIAVLIIALIVSYKNIGWATVIYALTVGFTMDFFEQMLAPLHISDLSIVIRLLCVCLGQLCFGITYALLIKYRKGMNQIDAISYAIEEKTHVPFKWIRTGMDVVLLIGGWLLGGVVGIGSVIAMTTTGILIDFFLHLLTKKEQI
ncbi:YitT family protein [Faecalicoccus pleomorphus]|uniref:YczE/YyaS/YitT family protein n=1 Tax=Faecalicoccus pleomorphus TaxID=1323 RepID=UPI002330DBBE|nr:YitT family protein [Faecalicoccus pleomorphus]MDB7988728.1 YitT family protein [Faecalicoccus pleomorphus]MDB7992993.1 YitT family protein [Faecalicoccus pleomorphus]